MKDLIRLFAILGAAAYLTGCTSMPQKFQDNVHIGDTTEHALEVMGNPSIIRPSVKIEDGTAYYWSTSSNTCAITSDNKTSRVALIMCEPNAQESRPWFVAQPIQRTSLNCTTNNLAGGISTISCN